MPAFKDYFQSTHFGALQRTLSKRSRGHGLGRTGARWAIRYRGACRSCRMKGFALPPSHWKPTLGLPPVLPHPAPQAPPSPAGPLRDIGWVHRAQSGVGAAGEGRHNRVETKGPVTLISTVCTSAEQQPGSPERSSWREEQSLASDPCMLSEYPGR